MASKCQFAEEGGDDSRLLFEFIVSASTSALIEKL